MTMVEKAISPHETALNDIAQQVWAFTQQSEQTPLVLITTNGPITALRQQLELTRPVNMPPKLVFLPKILGLQQWLSQTPSLMHFPPVKTALQRWEMVYAQLAKYPKIQEKFGALGEGGKWALVKAIVQASDFLTRSHFSFVFQGNENIEDIYQAAQHEFNQAILQAYPTVGQGLLQDEGSLILAFWKYLTSTEDPLVREAMAYQLRQRELVKISRCQPLVWIEMTTPLPSLVRIQELYLEEHSKHQPVLKLSMDWTVGSLWPECVQGQFDQLDEQTQQQIVDNRSSMKDHRWRLIAQPSFEKMAWGALACIREHIEAKRYRIALIAQDRLVARRVRALLDRLGPNLTVSDQTGWKLSTTSAAAAVHSFLELMNSGVGPNLSTLLGFLKNPFINWSSIIAQLTEHGDLEAEPFAWFIERTLLSRTSGSEWSEWAQVFEPDQRDQHDEAQQLHYLSYSQKLMLYLRDLATQWQGAYQSSHDWVTLFKLHLTQFGMIDALQEDPAGQSVLKEFEQLSLLEKAHINASSWISLFDTWMEQASFIQELAYQTVRISIIPLASIRLNYFDAVVMVGCDDRQLPSQPDHGSIFSRAMLKALDDQLPVYEYLSQARDLSQLLMAHRHVDFIWQEYQKAQEVNRPAAWLTRLQLGLPSFKDASVVLPIGEIQSQGIYSASTQVADAKLLPTYISPSSYQSLRSCPYRFFVQYILKLRSPKALQDISEFGSIGTLLHEVLKYFYRSYAKQPSFQNLDAQRLWMKKELEAISMEHWDRCIQQNGKMLYEQEQWLAQIPDWVQWQLHQEANGWKFVEAEKNLEFALPLAKGMSVLVKGRADRIDQKGTQEFRVWDYKFKSIEKLKKSQKLIDDDPQLLMYSNALIQDADQAITMNDAGWVSLRNPNDKARELLQVLDSEALVDLQDQMTSVLNQVWEGKPLVANGPSQICQYCDARGLCRKGMWES